MISTMEVSYHIGILGCDSATQFSNSWISITLKRPKKNIYNLLHLGRDRKFALVFFMLRNNIKKPMINDGKMLDMFPLLSQQKRTFNSMHYIIIYIFYFFIIIILTTNVFVICHLSSLKMAGPPLAKPKNL